MSFDGFPDNARATPVPDPFFNSLLAEIEDVAELKVTLRALWLLGQKRGAFRSLAAAELLNDPTLLKGIKSLGGDPQERVRQGLEQAVTRRTLLCCPVTPGPATPENPQSPEGREGLAGRRYLLNTAANRRELARRPGGPGQSQREEQWLVPPEAEAEMGPPELPADPRPNIFALYEDNIGLIGPVIAEQLRDAEAGYPRSWIAEAFRIAINENKRSWSYISAILRRWAAEGRGGDVREPSAGVGNPAGVGTKAGATLWERDGTPHGKSGRHTETDNRSPGPRSRQRR